MTESIIQTETTSRCSILEESVQLSDSDAYGFSTGVKSCIQVKHSIETVAISSISSWIMSCSKPLLYRVGNKVSVILIWETWIVEWLKNMLTLRK